MVARLPHGTCQPPGCGKSTVPHSRNRTEPAGLAPAARQNLPDPAARDRQNPGPAPLGHARTGWPADCESAANASEPSRPRRPFHARRGSGCRRASGAAGHGRNARVRRPGERGVCTAPARLAGVADGRRSGPVQPGPAPCRRTRHRSGRGRTASPRAHANRLLGHPRSRSVLSRARHRIAACTHARGFGSSLATTKPAANVPRHRHIWPSRSPAGNGRHLTHNSSRHGWPTCRRRPGSPLARPAPHTAVPPGARPRPAPAAPSGACPAPGRSSRVHPRRKPSRSPPRHASRS